MENFHFLLVMLVVRKQVQWLNFSFLFSSIYYKTYLLVFYFKILSYTHKFLSMHKNVFFHEQSKPILQILNNLYLEKKKHSKIFTQAKYNNILYGSLLFFFMYTPEITLNMQNYLFAIKMENYCLLKLSFYDNFLLRMLCNHSADLLYYY